MNDKIIQFPGAKPREAAPAPDAGTEQDEKTMHADAIDYAKERTDETTMSIVGPDGVPVPMSADQQKAFQLILSGLSFIMVALKPTATGCDFYTAVHGDKTDLRNAEGELPAVISRAYTRKGI